MKKERITITIPERMLEELDEMCAQSGYTRSFIIRRCIQIYFDLLDEEVKE